jgi:hypothetical protein
VIRSTATIGLGCLLLASVPADAAAQVRDSDPAEFAALRFGPVALTPTFALRDVGVDTNVFNQPDAKRDFTATFVPGVDAWMRVGRVHFSSETELEWLYFQDATSQRSFSVDQAGTIELPFTYFTPYVKGGYSNLRRRPNFEIDQRVRYITTSSAYGVRFYLGDRTRVDVERRQSRIDFSDEAFGDPTLAAALNRDNTGTHVAFRYALTGLTTVVTGVTVEEDRFLLSSLRDSDGVSVMGGFEFRPFALISGSAAVGYRTFETLDAAVPDFDGLVAAVDVKWVIRDMTRFIIGVDRDVQYSFELVEPFYVQTGWNVDARQMVSYNWDIEGRVGLTRLAYRQLATGIGQDSLGAGRVDRVSVYGVGIGRRIGTELRVGFDLNHVDRRSDASGRSYDGFRIGGTVTYGY